MSAASTCPAKLPVVRIEKFDNEAPNTKAMHPGSVHRVFSGATHKQYYFRLLAANSEIVAQSEAYTRKANRDKTVRLLLRAKLTEA